MRSAEVVRYMKIYVKISGDIFSYLVFRVYPYMCVLFTLSSYWR